MCGSFQNTDRTGCIDRFLQAFQQFGIWNSYDQGCFFYQPSIMTSIKIWRHRKLPNWFASASLPAWQTLLWMPADRHRSDRYKIIQQLWSDEGLSSFLRMYKKLLWYLWLWIWMRINRWHSSICLKIYRADKYLFFRKILCQKTEDDIIIYRNAPKDFYAC